jgi:AcrR family transcriptional regulator
MTTTREAVVAAAFRLFGSQGYEATSVDDIAVAAGISRSTFFRLYGTKEAVIFPDHDRWLREVEDRLAASSAGSAIGAVSDAVKLVLFHYVAEGERARERYRLTSSVTPLRERELVSSARYQRLFRRFIAGWGDGLQDSQLRAELMAAAVVAAHNRTLRRWLRDDISDPRPEIDAALSNVNAMFDQSSSSEVGVLMVVREGVSFEAAVNAIRGLPSD